MTLEELMEAAIKAINETPKPATPKIVLIMPGVWSKSRLKRLLPSGHCPVGTIMQETTDGLWVSFDAVEVRAFCVAKQGAAAVEEVERIIEEL